MQSSSLLWTSSFQGLLFLEIEGTSPFQGVLFLEVEGSNQWKVISWRMWLSMAASFSNYVVFSCSQCEGMWKTVQTSLKCV